MTRYLKPAVMFCVVAHQAIAGIPKVTPMIENNPIGPQSLASAAAYKADE